MSQCTAVAYRKTANSPLKPVERHRPVFADQHHQQHKYKVW